MEYAENIQLVINTLEDVEVRGSRNWDRMLACIQHLKAIQKEVNANAGSKTELQQRNSEDTADPV